MSVSLKICILEVSNYIHLNKYDYKKCHNSTSGFSLEVELKMKKKHNRKNIK